MRFIQDDKAPFIRMLLVEKDIIPRSHHQVFQHGIVGYQDMGDVFTDLPAGNQLVRKRYAAVQFLVIRVWPV